MTRYATWSARTWALTSILVLTTAASASAQRWRPNGSNRCQGGQCPSRQRAAGSVSTRWPSSNYRQPVTNRRRLPARRILPNRPFLPNLGLVSRSVEVVRPARPVEAVRPDRPETNARADLERKLRLQQQREIAALRSQLAKLQAQQAAPAEPAPAPKPSSADLGMAPAEAIHQANQQQARAAAEARPGVVNKLNGWIRNVGGFVAEIATLGAVNQDAAAPAPAPAASGGLAGDLGSQFGRLDYLTTQFNRIRKAGKAAYKVREFSMHEARALNQVTRQIAKGQRALKAYLSNQDYRSIPLGDAHLAKQRTQLIKDREAAVAELAQLQGEYREVTGEGMAVNGKLYGVPDGSVGSEGGLSRSAADHIGYQAAQVRQRIQQISAKLAGHNQRGISHQRENIVAYAAITQHQFDTVYFAREALREAESTLEADKGDTHPFVAALDAHLTAAIEDGKQAVKRTKKLAATHDKTNDLNRTQEYFRRRGARSAAD